MDLYDLICWAEVVVAIAVALLLWRRVRRMPADNWWRIWLAWSMVITVLLLVGATLMAGDPLGQLWMLVLGPLMAVCRVVPEAQLASAAEKALAAKQAQKRARDDMRELFRQPTSDQQDRP